MIAALALLLSPAPKALAAFCATPLIAPAPRISRIELLGVPWLPPAAALPSAIVKSGVAPPGCAARCARLMLLGSRVKTIFCETLSNEAVTPSWAALKLETNPSTEAALPAALKS